MHDDKGLASQCHLSPPWRSETTGLVAFVALKDSICDILQPGYVFLHLLNTKCQKCTLGLTKQKTKDKVSLSLALFIPEYKIAGSSTSIRLATNTDLIVMKYQVSELIK